MNRCFNIVLILCALSDFYIQSCYGSTLVQVAAWTPTGERIDKIWVVLSSRDGKEQYKGQGFLVNLPVPPGEYVLQTEAPGFKAKRQLLRTYPPAIFCTVMLRVARMHDQDRSNLTGTVQNYDGDLRDIRVRLIGLFGNDLWEAVPDRQGSVHFPVEEGAYLMLIVADLGHAISILDSRPLRLATGEHKVITIDLKEKRGTVFPLVPE